MILKNNVNDSQTASRFRQQIIDTHGDVCYECGEPLFDDPNDVIVIWQGPVYLGLHGACALRFGAELIRDARSVEEATGKRIKIKVSE